MRSVFSLLKYIPMEVWFQKFASKISYTLGSMPAFILTGALLIGTCLYFGFSRDWRETVSLLVTISTFLMLFFLQNSQNVDTKAIHIKLDEIIQAQEGARDEIAGVERETERTMEELRNGNRKLPL